MAEEPKKFYDTIDIYADWYGETDRIASLPYFERCVEIGNLLTQIYGTEAKGEQPDCLSGKEGSSPSGSAI